MKVSDAILIIFLLQLFTVVSCSKKESAVDSLVTEVEKNQVVEEAAYIPFSFEEVDSIRYIPNYKEYTYPPIETLYSPDPEQVKETIRQDFFIGTGIQEGKVYTYKPASKFITDDEILLLSKNTELQIVNTERKQIEDKYYLYCRELAKNTQGYILLEEVYYKKLVADSIVIGMIPRYEKLSRFNKYYDRDDKPFMANEEFYISYNSLYILKDGISYVISGGEFDRYFNTYKSASIIRFGYKNCELKDINNSGSDELIIVYESNGSFSFLGVSTGPSVIVLSFTDKEIVPVLQYTICSHEDWGSTYAYPVFMDVNNDGLRETLELYTFDSSDGTISLHKDFYEYNGYQFKYSSKKQLFKNEESYSLCVGSDTADIYNTAWSKSDIIGALDKDDIITINDAYIEGVHSPFSSILWLKLVDDSGWVDCMNVLPFKVNFECQEKDKDQDVSSVFNVNPDITQIENQFGFINDSDVRFRTHPSVDSEIFRKLNKDEQVELISKTAVKERIDTMDSYWYQVKSTKNEIGWVYGHFLTLQEKRSN